MKNSIKKILTTLFIIIVISLISLFVIKSRNNEKYTIYGCVEKVAESSLDSNSYVFIRTDKNLEKIYVNKTQVPNIGDSVYVTKSNYITHNKYKNDYVIYLIRNNNVEDIVTIKDNIDTVKTTKPLFTPTHKVESKPDTIIIHNKSAENDTVI